jgi:WS/DGAT/MGAT family acyltransferase
MPAVVTRTAMQVPAAALGFLHSLRTAGRSVALPLTAPRVHFNRSITSKRSVALTALPLRDVRRVADAFDLTINDVLMTVCAGALRQWLQDNDELPRRPLIAAVPVAMRADEHHAGNRLSVMFAALPTHLADVRGRLDFVAKGMRDAKATHAEVRPRTLAALAEAMPWNVLGLLFHVYSDLGLASRLPPAVNVVVSNVPGPPVPVYCGGAKLVSLYALGPIFDGAGLNITFTSCADEVDVGIVACPDVTSSLDGIVESLSEALAELVVLAANSSHG